MDVVSHHTERGRHDDAILCAVVARTPGPSGTCHSCACVRTGRWSNESSGSQSLPSMLSKPPDAQCRLRRRHVQHIEIISDYVTHHGIERDQAAPSENDLRERGQLAEYFFSVTRYDVVARKL